MSDYGILCRTKDAKRAEWLKVHAPESSGWRAGGFTPRAGRVPWRRKGWRPSFVPHTPMRCSGWGVDLSPSDEAVEGRNDRLRRMSRCNFCGNPVPGHYGWHICRGYLRFDYVVEGNLNPDRPVHDYPASSRIVLSDEDMAELDAL